MPAIRFGNRAGARARLRNADMHDLVSGIASAPDVLSPAGRRPAVHPYSAVYETFVAGRSWGETLQFATRANACADHRRTSAPSRAGTPIMRAAGLLRRQRCEPVRAADALPATEPLSVPAGRESGS